MFPDEVGFAATVPQPVSHEDPFNLEAPAAKIPRAKLKWETEGLKPNKFLFGEL